MFRSTLPVGAAAVAVPILEARPVPAVTWTAIPPLLADQETCFTDHWNNRAWTTMSRPAAVTKLTSASTPLGVAIVWAAGSTGPSAAANSLTRLNH
jgi:hypothetical protein